VYLTVLSLLAALWWPACWVGTVMLAGAVTAVNRSFYHYFASRAGMWFAMRVVPLHWLYFGYCGFCMVWGTLLHALTSQPGTSLPLRLPATFRQSTGNSYR